MARKWNKTVNKIKDKLYQQTEALKSQITGSPVEGKQECMAMPDVCIVRQIRRHEECLSCGNFRRD
jgi:hypothetical protein